MSAVAGSGEYCAPERVLLAGMERVLAMADATVLKKGDPWWMMNAPLTGRSELLHGGIMMSSSSIDARAR